MGTLIYRIIIILLLSAILYINIDNTKSIKTIETTLLYDYEINK